MVVKRFASEIGYMIPEIAIIALCVEEAWTLSPGRTDSKELHFDFPVASA